MVKKLQNKKTIFCCPRKGCNAEFQNKGLFKNHCKNKCPFLSKLNSKSTRNSIDLSSLIVEKKIGKGGYGTIFSAKIRNLEYAIKYIKSSESFKIEKEVYSHIREQKIKGFMNYFGDLTEYSLNILVFEKLSGNLREAMQCMEFTFHTLKNLFIQCLQKLRQLHNIGYVHRDLKLNNFMFKKKTIYLIDFGNCKRIPQERKESSVFGDLNYMSIDSHSFLDQIEKDDVESLTYIFIETIGPLYWDVIYCKYKHGEISMFEAMDKIKLLKIYFLENQQEFQNIPLFFFEILHYLRKLEGQPDYDKIELLISKWDVDESETKFSWLKFSNNAKNPIINLNILDREIYEEKDKQQQILEFENEINFINLPNSLLVKYKKSEKISNATIIEELRAKGWIFKKNYNYIECMSIKRLTESLEAHSPGIYLILNKSLTLEENHFFVILLTENDVISFDGIENVGQFTYSRKRIKQNDNWSCGYIAFLWIDKILSVGIQKWLEFEEEFLKK